MTWAISLTALDAVYPINEDERTQELQTIEEAEQSAERGDE